MKTNLKLFGPRMGIMLAGLLVLMTAFGCKKEPIPVEKVENTLSVDLTEVTLKPEGETVRIPIETNAPLAEPKCTHDWLVAEISEENDELIITAEVNTTGEGRSAIITLKTAALEGDQAKAQVTVNQATVNAAELFKFAKEEYSLNYAEGTDQVALISDGPWEIDQNLPGWVEITPTIGEGDAVITVKYKKNVSVSERPSQIIFKNSKLNSSAVLSLRQVGNPTGLNDFSHLGKGYDITGMYAYDSEVKASVLDCQKLYMENHIADALRPNITEVQQIVGKNRTEYIENYTRSATASISSPGLEGAAPVLGFKGSVETTFNGEYGNSSENSYATLRNLTKKVIIKTHENLTAKQLIPCLNEIFVEDCKTLSAADLVLKYGTHVILGLSLGGVLDFSMTADLSNQHENFGWSTAVSGGFNMTTGIKLEGSANVSTSEYESLTKSESYLETKIICRGGEPQYASPDIWGPSAGTPDAGGESTYSNWLASLEAQEKWVMVSYEGNMLVPLDKFIEDPNKANEVKQQIEGYISDHQLPPQESKFGLASLELVAARNDSQRSMLDGMTMEVNVKNDNKFTHKGTELFLDTNPIWASPSQDGGLIYDLNKYCMLTHNPLKANKRHTELKLQLTSVMVGGQIEEGTVDLLTLKYNKDKEVWTDGKNEYKNNSKITVTAFDNGDVTGNVTMDFILHWQTK